MKHDHYKSVVYNAPFGYACHEIITDKAGNPVDYRYSEVNAAYEELIGLQAKDVVGKTISEIAAGSEKLLEQLFSCFAEVVSTGNPKEFEIHVKPTDIWYKVHAYLPGNNTIVATFTDVTELKKNREAIEQKNRLDAVLKAVPDALFVIDKNGKCLNVYSSNPDILIKPPDELAGMSIFDFIRKEDAEEFLNIQRNCIIKKEIYTFEYNMLIGGKVRYFEGKFSPVDDEKLICIVRDITKQKELLEAHENELSFKKFLFENAREGLVLLNNDHKVIDANKRFAEMLGYNMDELKQLHTWDFDAFATEDMIREGFGKSREINETFESMHQRKDGSRYHVEVSAKSFLWKGERLVFCFSRDISDKVHAANAIKNSEAKYRSITKQLAEMLYLHAADGKILEVNETALVETGYSEEELLTMNVFDIHCTELNPVPKEVILDLWKTYKTGERHTFEVFHRRKDGSVFPVEIKTGKISFGDEDYILALGQNITERKLTENKLIESDRLKTAFINNISHEIRTPLNTILGFGELMMDEELTRSQRLKHYDVLERSSRRLMQTITDIMDISMINSGTIITHQTEFELHALLEDLLDRANGLCEGKNVVATLETPDSEKEIVLLTDKTLLEKVLHHLISNAAKFTSEGRIGFGFRIKDGFIEFFVKDTGSGIDFHKQKLIFEAFRQGDSSTTRGYEGSGLGLSISSAFINMLGGKIWLESEVDKGSTFYFSIPYQAVEAARTEVSSKEVHKKDIEDILVLIAEDDDSNYFYLFAVLESEGISSLHAVNGAEAVNMCKEYPEISMVLMDIKMPVMNGIEATRKIKAERPELPIIAVTAHAQTGDEQRLLEAGCDAYAAKPVSRQKLLELVSKYVKI